MEAMTSAGRDQCLVINDDRVVLGRLRRSDSTRADTPVTDVMESGPTTIRASEDLVGLVERMRHRRVSDIIVTDPDGRLLGIVRRDEAEQRLADDA
jgi:Mg/Co/Ni transporter MgtE